MPIFSQKNINSLKNDVLSYNFFSNFSWKTHKAVIPIFGQKNVNSDKTTLYLEPWTN